MLKSVDCQHGEPCDETYQSITTGLQCDSSTCGFWVLLTAFSILLGFLLSSSMCQLLTAGDVKELLGSIYTAYIPDNHGVFTEVMQNLFAQFEPTVFWDDILAIIRHFPCIMLHHCTSDSSAVPQFSPQGATQAHVTPNSSQASSGNTIVINNNHRHSAHAETGACTLNMHHDTPQHDLHMKLAILHKNPNFVWGIDSTSFFNHGLTGYSQARISLISL